MKERVYNFNPGPATLPVSVLEIVKNEMLNYHGEGMSILEMSHRSKTFEGILNNAIASIKKVFLKRRSYQLNTK